MHEINLDDAKIKIDGEWLSTEDLARKIEEKIQAGDLKISHLATALEELNKAIENSHTIEIKLAISNQDYEKLKALGGENDREAVRKATLSFIKGHKQIEQPLSVETTEAAVEESVSEPPPPAEDIEAPVEKLSVEEPAGEPPPPAKDTKAPVEELSVEDLSIEKPADETPPSAKDTQVPVEEPEEAADKKVVVNCFKCKSPIDITTDERPIDIKCPNCNTTGRLDSNNNMQPRHQDHFLG
ncbi:hypothetical protein ACFL03_05770 [Thermodesulfobacteriota bacterium]